MAAERRSMFMRAAMAALLVAGFSLPIEAQVQPGQGVIAVPPITPGHCAQWQTPYSLSDFGAACGGGGGGGTPGGLTGEIQYNAGAGSFGGVTGATTDGTKLTLASPAFSGTVSGAGTVPNSVLQNSSVTIGSTAIDLGASATTISGLTLASPTFSGTAAGASTIPNAVLVNSSLTIAGHSVSLGGTQSLACSDLTGVAASCSTDTTNAANITSGTLPNARIVALPNTSLANAATTVNGQTCTLGSTCTVSAAASGVTIESTTITSGTSNGLLYDHAGVIGNLASGNSGVLVTSGAGVPSISPTLPNGLALGTPGSVTLTNGTALPISGITGLGTGVGTALAAAVSGSGSICLTTSCSMTTPSLGVASATSVKVANGAVGTPSFSFTTDATTGLYFTTGAINFAIGGALVGFVDTNGIESSSSTGARIVAGGATSTAPSVLVNKSDTKSGLGADAAGDVSIIANNAGTATEIARFGGAATALNASSISLPNVPLDTALVDRTLCLSSGVLKAGSGVNGICLGTSSRRYKHDIALFKEDALADVMKLRPSTFKYNFGYGDNGAKTQYGFIAEDAIHEVPGIVGLDKNGRPNTVDMLAVVPILVRAMQQQQKEISLLKRALSKGKHQ